MIFNVIIIIFVIFLLKVKVKVINLSITNETLKYKVQIGIFLFSVPIFVINIDDLNKKRSKKYLSLMLNYKNIKEKINSKVNLEYFRLEQIYLKLYFGFNNIAMTTYTVMLLEIITRIALNEKSKRYLLKIAPIYSNDYKIDLSLTLTISANLIKSIYMLKKKERKVNDYGGESNTRNDEYCNEQH